MSEELSNWFKLVKMEVNSPETKKRIGCARRTDAQAELAQLYHESSPCFESHGVVFDWGFNHTISIR
jgi:hypothetical protein